MLIRLIYLALYKYQYEEASKEKLIIFYGGISLPLHFPYFSKFSVRSFEGQQEKNVTARNQS